MPLREGPGDNAVPQWRRPGMTRSISRQERRTVRPRIRSGPVNRWMLYACTLGGFAYATYPADGNDAILLSYSGAAAIGTVFSIIRAAKAAIKDYRLRKGLAIAEVKSTDHGSAREATFEERAAVGMHDPGTGELFGTDLEGNSVFRPTGAPFALIEMPPGVGKTVNLVVGSILHRTLLGYSLITPDVKCENSVMLVAALRELGFEVWCINPAKLHLDQLGDVELNPYQALIDAVYDSGGRMRDAVKIAADIAALHLPAIKDDRNPYFSNGSRRVILVALLYLALVDPANCTPTQLYRLLADPAAFLKCCAQLQSVETSKVNDRVLEVARLEARNMLDRADKNDENFSSFLEGATQRLISFNPAGHLGDYGANAVHNLRALRDRQIIVFIVAPLSHLREFSDCISLLTHNVIAACKAKPNGHPVHIVGEEALNFRFQDLVGDLETIRGLGVTADLYIQSFAGLERHYGKEAAAAIESYADVRIYGGLNSYARAKHVSDLLADETIRKQDGSYHTVSMVELNISSKETGRRYMTTDEVMAMPKGQAWMFARGMRPTRLRMLSYAEVSPWRDWVGESPITGMRLHAPARIKIDYEGLKEQKR